MRNRLSSALTVWVVALACLTLPCEDRIDTGMLGPFGVAFRTSVDSSPGLEVAGGLGDVDGDGHDDLGLSIAEPDQAGDHSWTFRILYGQARLTGEVPLAPPLTRSWQLRVTDPDPSIEWWGRCAIDFAPAGDLNDDGFGDFLLGFGLYPAITLPGSGLALLVRGGRDLEGFTRFEDLIRDKRTTMFRSSSPLHRTVGLRCRVAGDFNGDGEKDFVIAAPNSSLESALDLDQGAMFIVLGGPDLPPEVDLARVGDTLPGTRIEGFEEYREDRGRVYGLDLGDEIAAVGDFNGDGLSDVAAVASTRLPASIYIILGEPNPPPVIRLVDASSYPNVIEIRGENGGGNFLGWFGLDRQIAGLGDVNGDGFADLAVSRAAQCCPFEPVRSFVQVFFGKPDFPRLVSFDSLDPALGVTLEPREEKTLFGRYISMAGDFDGDGRPDLLIGAPGANPDRRSQAGEAYVLLSRTGFAAPSALRGSYPGVRIQGQGPLEKFGGWVAPAGDFDADGFDDILVVSRRQMFPAEIKDYPGVTRVYLIYGGTMSSAPLDVIDVQPSFGPSSGGKKVRLVGSGFAPGVKVTLGGVESSSVEVLSSSELEVVIPPASRGLVDVSVSLRGETDTLPKSFFYSPLLPVELDRLDARGFTIHGKEDVYLGSSGAAGDFNGDGVDDLLLSVLPGPWVNVTGGRYALIVWGHRVAQDVAAFDPSERVTVLHPPWETEQLEVSSPGDVDGDGMDDFLIALDGGLGHLVRGRHDWPGEIGVEDLFRDGGVTEIRIPEDVDTWHGTFTAVGLGDLTGDGINDFALSIDRKKGRDPESEIVFVEGRRVWDTLLELPDQASGRVRGGEEAIDLGWQLEAVGDVNGDGLGDVLANSEPGARQTAYLIFGSPALFRGASEDLGALVKDPARARSFLTISDEHAWGLVISRAGDVNGDGYADLLLGLPQGAEIIWGRSFLVFGSPSLENLEIVDGGEVPQGVTSILGDRTPHQNAHVAPCGDIDGDGFADFSVTSRIGIPPDPGYTYVVMGSESFPSTMELGTPGLESFRIDGLVPLTTVAEYTSAVGDFNGDGVDDFALRERARPEEPVNSLPAAAGAIYVILGEATGPRFVRGDSNSDGAINLTDPVALLNRLFRGGDALACDDAGDADDDRRLTLTDAVYVLSHLFQSGPGPAAPYPEAGKDPTPDELGCERGAER